MRTAALTALATAGLLAGCGSDLSSPGDFTGDKWNVDAVAALPLTGDPLTDALQEGYIGLAKAELAEFDWADGAEFTAKARSASMGQLPAPFDPALRVPDGPDAEALKEASTELGAYLVNVGARLRAGRQIGEAQVLFDCWVQESEEGHQSADIGTCRNDYLAMIELVRTLGALPDNMAVVLPEKDGEIGGIELAQGEKSVALDNAFAAAGTGDNFGDVPVEEGEIRDAFAGALAAQPKPPVKFTLTFEFASTGLSDQAYDLIAQAAEEALSRAAAEIIVTGFTDAPGSPGANQALSQRRAALVRREVERELGAHETGGRDTSKTSVTARARGERDPVVDSAQREEQNRRVEILVR